jgi:CHAT domain-containing protein
VPSRDFVLHEERHEFRSDKQKQDYANAWRTLEMEQRVISCLTARLSVALTTIPLQLAPLTGKIHNAISALNAALEHNSRKIADLFRTVEALLLEVLPEGVEQYLKKDSTPVVFLSDLPMEWTLVEEWPLCLTRPVSRIPLGLTRWDVFTAVLETRVRIDVGKPERVLVLDLLGERDVIRRYSDAFAETSTAIGQRYTYASPGKAEELAKILTDAKADIVVVDAHGRYDRRKDELSIEVKDQLVPIDDLLPDSRVSPVWILSACHTSVTGALTGCFVRKLISRGAVCVIASLNRVNAWTASMFVGRLLTELYSPVIPDQHTSLDTAFFATQYTTALLYDPLLPLFRKAERDATLRKILGIVMGDFLKWVHGKELDIRRYRYEIAVFLNDTLEKYGLAKQLEENAKTGVLIPETLLFTAFGAPGRVEIERPGFQRT